MRPKQEAGMHDLGLALEPLNGYAQEFKFTCSPVRSEDDVMPPKTTGSERVQRSTVHPLT